MPYYPGDPEPHITRLADHERGDEWTTTHLSFCAHLGTHVDAPLHRIRGGKTLDDPNWDRLLGPAFVADLSFCEREITAADLQAANLPAGVRRLLLKTQNGALWERRGFQTDYVALSGDAAGWLVERDVRLVGLDYLSADVYHTESFPAHTLLLQAEIVIVEGMVLSTVESGWYTLICLPLRVQGAEGAPARAILVSGTQWFFEEEK